MNADFLRFYQFSDYQLTWIFVLSFQCSGNFLNYHSHRMASIRGSFDPFDSTGIGFGNEKRALHHDLLLSVISLTGWLAWMGIIETFLPAYFQVAMKIWSVNWPSMYWVRAVKVMLELQLLVVIEIVWLSFHCHQNDFSICEIIKFMFKKNTTLIHQKVNVLNFKFNLFKDFCLITYPVDIGQTFNAQCFS